MLRHTHTDGNPQVNPQGQTCGSHLCIVSYLQPALDTFAN